MKPFLITILTLTVSITLDQKSAQDDSIYHIRDSVFILKKSGVAISARFGEREL